MVHQIDDRRPADRLASREKMRQMDKIQSQGGGKKGCLIVYMIDYLSCGLSRDGDQISRVVKEGS